MVEAGAMAKRRRKAPPRGLAPVPVLEPNAAGVDIGATEIYIAVPVDRDSEPVRRLMRAKLGAPKAITAAAHKLAPILFHLLSTRTPYDESVFAHQEIQNNHRMQRKLQQQAKSYGFQLIEITPS